MYLSVIVPAYKQESTIKSDLERLYKTLSDGPYDFEIIVVVDGLLDKTFDIANTLSKELKKLHVAGYKVNRGKGYAVRYGMARSKGDHIVFIDSGMEIHPSGIFALLDIMKENDADVVVGSKRHPESELIYPRIRKFYSSVYYLLVRILFGLRVTDTQVGLKVFRREVLEKVLPRLLVKTYAFDIELLSVANKLGFKKIYDAPIKIDYPDADFEVLAENRLSDNIFLFLNPSVRKSLSDTFAIFFRLRILDYYADSRRRLWLYDSNLDMNINTGVIEDNPLSVLFLPKGEGRTGLEPLPGYVKFSIIVIHEGDASALKQCLQSLDLLEYPVFEVLVVLNDSLLTDDSREFADIFEGIKNKDKISLIKTSKASVAQQRNLAVKKSEGDVLVFLDEICFPVEGWLSHAREVFTKRAVYALGGPALTRTGASLSEKYAGLTLESKFTGFSTSIRHKVSEPRFVRDLPFSNLFIRKDAFLNVHGFDQTVWPAEDIDLLFRLGAVFNCGILYSSAAYVYIKRKPLIKPYLKEISFFASRRGYIIRMTKKKFKYVPYFVPTLCLLLLIFFPVLSLVFPSSLLLFAWVLLFYIFFLVYASLKAAIRNLDPLAFFIMVVMIPLTHIFYGVNFLLGFIKHPHIKLKY